MSRNKNGKFNATVGHFVRKRPDSIRDSNKTVPIPPLYKAPLSPFCWEEPRPSSESSYAASVPVYESMPSNYRLFFDTGFITSREIPRELWASICDKHIFVTREVWQELQPWVSKPWCNEWFRDYLVEAIKLESAGVGHPRVSLASVSDFAGGLPEVARYYINLLWMRKYFGIHRYELFLLENGREPTPSEMQVICEKFSGARGWRMAKKAIEERHRPFVFTDETLIVNAVFHSIVFGAPTVIFTRDNDVIEQFYKIIYLVDTHYMSMLMANKYHSSPSDFRAIPAPKGDNALYEGDGNLLLSMQGELTALRPSDVPPIQCTCGLFSTSDKPLMFSSRTFGIAQDMERVLRMKEKTRGRNTDLFGKMNFHVELDPRRQMFGKSGPALVNEKYVELKGGDHYPVSITDSELAVFTDEGFSTERFMFGE